MRARSGISLFEAVVALTIVGLTSVAALEAVGAEMRTAGRARRALEAEALATQRIDFMALMNDQELQNLPDSVAKGKFDPPLSDYHWTTTASPVDAQPGVYDVRLRVEWTDGSYLLRTYLFRRPRVATTR